MQKACAIGYPDSIGASSPYIPLEQTAPARASRKLGGAARAAHGNWSAMEATSTVDLDSMAIPNTASMTNGDLLV